MTKVLKKQEKALHACGNGTEKTLYLIIYDIDHPKFLQKVAGLLEKYGYLRWQKSVWLGAEPPDAIPPLMGKLNYLYKQFNQGGSTIQWCKIAKQGLKQRKAIGDTGKHIEWLLDPPAIWYFD